MFVRSGGVQDAKGQGMREMREFTKALESVLMRESVYVLKDHCRTRLSNSIVANFLLPYYLKARWIVETGDRLWKRECPPKLPLTVE